MLVGNGSAVDSSLSFSCSWLGLLVYDRSIGLFSDVSLKYSGGFSRYMITIPSSSELLSSSNIVFFTGTVRFCNRGDTRDLRFRLS